MTRDEIKSAIAGIVAAIIIAIFFP